MQVARRLAVAAGLVVVLAATGSTRAHAATGPMAAVVARQERLLNADGRVLGSNQAVHNAAQAQHEIAKTETFIGDLHAAGAAVMRLNPASSAEQQAQSDWAAGIREMVGGYKQSEPAIRDLGAGKLLAADRVINAADRTVSRAGRLLQATNRLLHLPARVL
jgi:hypothetical protein